MEAMSDVAPLLEAPILLLAMPQVADPFFNQSVVLLLHHDEDDGSLGFILNRPTTMRLAEILEGMEIVWQGVEQALAHFGGPVQPQLGTVLFAPEQGWSVNGETATEVLPGIVLTQHVGDLEELARHPPARLRLFLGYAGWGAGQLTSEILRNDWLTAPVDRDLIFDTEPDGTWARALRSVGVDPAALPSWTAGAGDDGAN